METATLIIETRGLSKTFGRVRAVNGIDLRVRRGEIYGFLGLNGAGKTTTIRALLGMIRPSAGTVKIFGETVGGHSNGLWRRVGHMVETPAAYPELTVRENLDIARRLQGIADPKAVTRVMERLNITQYAERKAGVLSTGNLQRLGLARALLHEPELLILDEPTNGLDPAGVVEIRELLASLCRNQGVTVFMSSHILTEVDRLAARIGIIHCGRLISELEADELEALRAQHLVVKTRDLPGAQKTLAQAGYSVEANGTVLLLRDARAVAQPEEVAVTLVNAGQPPVHLAVEQENLEEYFLRLTGEKA